MTGFSDDDPVLARRARYRQWSSVGQRAGMMLYGVALVTLVIGLSRGFTASWSSATAAALIGGSVILAPSILLAYLVRGAERHEASEAMRPRP